MAIKYKAFWVDEETHAKGKVLASLEKQSINDYMTWFINMAYEAAEHNQRGHLKSKIEQILKEGKF